MVQSESYLFNIRKFASNHCKDFNMTLDENSADSYLSNGKLDPPEKDDIPLSIQKSINNVIKKEGYIDYNVINRSISTGGGNYLGILLEVDVKGQTKDGEKETNIFVKQIIPGDQMKFMSITECYDKESYFYNELLAIYHELQDTAGVPDTERFKAVKSFNESNSEAIILDNVSRKGFNTLHRMEVVPLRFAELSIEQLAKFHGLSMVLKDQRREYFERKLKVLESSIVLNNDFETFSQKMCDLACEHLTEDSRKRMEKLKKCFLEKFKRCWITSRTECICHGDYRPNNILFKEVEGEIQEVVPVDFQLLHYGCPITDFIYFILMGSDREFRRKHMENLKQLYYKTLANFLKYFNMDLDILFPKSEFENRFKEALEYGLLVCINTFPFIFTLESDVPDVGKIDFTDAEFKLDDRYRERIQGTMDDFIEWGYI